jgi:hypothetical protein
MSEGDPRLVSERGRRQRAVERDPRDVARRNLFRA